MPSIGDRLAHAWNAFMNKDPTIWNQNVGESSYIPPGRVKVNYGNDRTIVTSIYNRIAVDCAAIDIRHIRVDENGRYKEELKTSLNRCFSIEANADQTGRNLVQAIVTMMIEEGYAAVVPTDTSFDPLQSDSYTIDKLRVGKIIEWFPDRVKMEVYNELMSRNQIVMMMKKDVAIIENPFYNIMNAPNGILKRLTRKLAILDTLDDNALSGKLDLIVQLPYTLKSDLRKNQADARRKELESQMNSKLGIGYIDGTEKIIQLNRPLENNLMVQVEYLTRMLCSQLGSEEIWQGKANEQQMLNYYTHTIEPIMVAITEECTRKFLSKTAITQGQAVKFYRDPFKLVTIENLVDLGDKFTRNEILTSNEVRSIIGMKPSKEKNADELRNKSLYPEEMPPGYNSEEDSNVEFNSEENIQEY